MRASKVSRFVSLTLAAAAASVSGQIALAQQADTSAGVLEEIVVTTARQRAENLQDVPASITAITSSTLEAAAVDRAGDFIRLTPGVSMVQAAEVGDAQVNIRGINGARDAENSFALIVDGVLQTNPAAFNREYADLQQIEIVKGPQGAIYGRNAAAGAIIVTTTKPGSAFAGDAKLGYGEDNTQTGSLVLSGPLSDRAGWKLSGDYRKTDGFFKNVYSGLKNVDDYEGWNVNARVLFEPTDASTLDFKAHYGKVEAASISFNANFLAATLAGILGIPELNENVNQHKFDFVNNIDPYNNQEALDVSLKWDQDLSFGKLTAWTLYSDIKNDLGSDGTSATYGFFWGEPACINSLVTPPPGGVAGFTAPAPQFYGPTPAASVLGPYTATSCDGTQYQVRNQKDISFELRLASSGDERLRWLVGAYYLNIDREVGISTGVEDAGRVIPSLYIPQGQANATEQLVWDNFKSDVYAGFTNFAYDVTDQVEAALALRYDVEKRKVKNLVPTAARTTYFDYNPFDGVFTGNAPLNPALNPAINPSGVIPDREREFKQFQPKVSLTWEPSTAWTWYVNWGVGFKSGGFNNSGSAATVDLFINCFTGVGPAGQPNSCTPANPVPTYRSVLVRDDYDKEKSSAAELGFKANLLDRRLSLETSLFHTSVDDMQFFEFMVGQFGLLRVVNNIDEVTLKGLEISANYRVTDDLRLVAGYSRVMSEIKANGSRPASVGNESPYTPDYTATIGAEFDVPVGESWRMQASAYYNLVGPTWFHVIQAQDNNTVAFLPGNYSNAERQKFGTVDARFGVASDHWSVALVGKNVTNERYLQEVIPAPEFGGAFIHPGAERRVSVEVGYKF
ncbi:MAG: TonB-dependent receptor [Sinobacteraceae bacterium]|nr:TonB-dependent receptor [Nevskiaceae bacterium]